MVKKVLVPNRARTCNDYDQDFTWGSLEKFPILKDPLTDKNLTLISLDT